MTEQQIKHLKKILASSEKFESPNHLDEKIIATAHERAPSKPRYSLFPQIPSLNFAGSAVLSIALTVLIFAAMGQMLSNREPSLADENERQKYDQVVVIDEQSTTTEIETSTPTLVVEPPMTPEYRDQILAEMVLPNTKALMDDMEFPLVADRNNAEIFISTALSDIRFMIMDGELNRARQRYERLRRSCQNCALPQTLEALLLSKSSQATRS